MKKLFTIGVILSIIIPIGAIILIFIFSPYKCTCPISYYKILLTSLPLLVSIGNIFALLLVNKTLIEHNDEENRKEIDSKYRLAKTKILYERYEKFRIDWRNSYIIYQNSSNENEEAFDAWKSVFYTFCNDVKLLSPKILNIPIVKWWLDEFSQVEERYKSSSIFDANTASQTWSPKALELMIDLIDDIFEQKHSNE